MQARIHIDLSTPRQALLCTRCNGVLVKARTLPELRNKLKEAGHAASRI